MTDTARPDLDAIAAPTDVETAVAVEIRDRTGLVWHVSLAAARVAVAEMRSVVATARREERERAIRAVVSVVNDKTLLREVHALQSACDAIRALPDVYDTAMSTNPERRPVKECADGAPHRPHPWDDVHGTARHCPGEPARTTEED